MAEFKQKVNCVACGNKNTVSIITRQTKYSRSVKVMKCTVCNHQAGVKATLNAN